MTEHPPPGSVSEAWQGHVARIVSAAEQAATDLQREVELEAVRRAAAVRAQAQAEADRIRAEAEAQARTYLDDMRIRVDAFASARVDRISKLTDGLLAGGEAIGSRLEEAIDLQTQLQDLLTALAAAARAAAAEGARPAVGLPKVLEDPRPDDASASGRGHAAPTAAPGEGVDAGAHVQQIAQDLPRASPPTSPTEDQPA